MRTVDIEEAKAVHSRILVFDGHNDTAVERVHRGEAPLNWMQRDSAYHMDVPRMREGGFDGGFFIVGNGPTADVMFTLQRTLAQIDTNPGDLRLVLSSQDVADAKAHGQIGILMTIEGAQRWLRGELDMVVPLAKQSMTEAYPLRVPLVVDARVGPNWRDLEET